MVRGRTENLHQDKFILLLQSEPQLILSIVLSFGRKCLLAANHPPALLVVPPPSVSVGTTPCNQATEK